MEMYPRRASLSVQKWVRPEELAWTERESTSYGQVIQWQVTPGPAEFVLAHHPSGLLEVHVLYELTVHNGAMMNVSRRQSIPSCRVLQLFPTNGAGDALFVEARSLYEDMVVAGERVEVNTRRVAWPQKELPVRNVRGVLSKYPELQARVVSVLEEAVLKKGYTTFSSPETTQDNRGMKAEYHLLSY